MRRERYVPRNLVTALCVVGLLLPASVAAAADPRSELDEVKEQLESTRHGVERLDQRKQTELADLEVVDARQQELGAELARLNGELSEAEEVLAEAESRLDATTQKLTATQQRLDQTRARLDAKRDVFAERARASYMYGGSSAMVTLVLDMEDAETFARGVKYARAVMAHDHQQVVLIAGLEREVERATAELTLLQAERAEQESLATQERDRVAGIVADREEVAERVAAEAETHRRLIAELEADRDTKVAMIDQLEAESAELEEELRRRAEEAARRRAAEEAARQAAEEAARREAAAAARAAQRAEAAEAAERAREVAAAVAAEQAAAEEAAAAAAEQAAAEEAAAEEAAAEAAEVTTAEDEVEEVVQRPAPPPPPAEATDSGWAWPADGPITSGFGPRWGRMHTGIDIGAPMGAPIYAPTDGVVYSAGYNSGGYGNLTVIEHGGGLSTVYAHQSSILVSAGQAVARGQVIGYVGSTGHSTGPHLHFEVRINGSPVDPMGYL